MEENEARDGAKRLSGEQLEALNLFLNAAMPEEGIPCPLTGEAVAITDWNAPAGAVVLPGAEGGPGYECLPLTSPAGGVVLVSAARLAEWRERQAEKDGEGNGKDGE